jgi:hypothetical protein
LPSASSPSRAAAEEVEKAKRAEVDLVGQTLRFVDTKTGQSIRPLGRPAVQAFREALTRSQGEHVFPGTRAEKSHFTGLAKGWVRIVGDKLPGVTPQSVFEKGISWSAWA